MSQVGSQIFAWMDAEGQDGEDYDTDPQRVRVSIIKGRGARLQFIEKTTNSFIDVNLADFEALLEELKER